MLAPWDYSQVNGQDLPAPFKFYFKRLGCFYGDEYPRYGERLELAHECAGEEWYVSCNNDKCELNSVPPACDEDHGSTFFLEHETLVRQKSPILYGDTVRIRNEQTKVSVRPQGGATHQGGIIPREAAPTTGTVDTLYAPAAATLKTS